VAWFGDCPSAEDREACAALASEFDPVASDPRTGLRIYWRHGFRLAEHLEAFVADPTKW
jgi:hypothetical protein